MSPMLTSDFDYHLPPDMIAQTPMEPRDHSRLLTLDRANGRVGHRRFFDLPDLLREGDLLVFNDSRVFPARLNGRGGPSGREIELLLLTRLGKGTWRSLVRPGRRMRDGAEFTVTDRDGINEARGRVLEVEEAGTRIVSFEDESTLREVGVIPLPPYIHESLDDPERYQTVYSDREGSAAAPTAGLHFTQALLDRLGRHGRGEGVRHAARRLGLVQAGEIGVRRRTRDALRVLGVVRVLSRCDKQREVRGETGHIGRHDRRPAAGERGHTV